MGRFQVPKGEAARITFLRGDPIGYRTQLILLHQRNEWEAHCYHCLKKAPFQPFEACPSRARTPTTRMQLLTDDQ